MRDEDGLEYINNFILYDVNMEYYSNLWYTKAKKKDDDILLIMLGLDRKDLLELSKKNKVVERYMNEIDRVNENPEFREYMSYDEEQRKIRNTLISAARKEGLEQGAREIEKKLVDNMIKFGISKEDIAKIIEKDNID